MGAILVLVLHCTSMVRTGHREEGLAALLMGDAGARGCKGRRRLGGGCHFPCPLTVIGSLGLFPVQ